MAFFNSAVTVLQTLVIAIGAGLGIWGVINLLEGYGNDNPGAKLTGTKRSTFEERYAFELRKYREAGAILARWEADGERIDCKGWREALKHLNKERFLLDYELQQQKEEVRRLEVVKREFIRENRRPRPERYER